jgi:hypothetical protein
MVVRDAEHGNWRRKKRSFREIWDFNETPRLAKESVLPERVYIMSHSIAAK